MFVLALTVACGRLAVAGESDISRFAVAGSNHVDASSPPPGLYVFPGDGYDGQFAYRLGLAPYDLRTNAHGIIIDLPLRMQRIGYPTLAWLLAAGQARWVALTLVAVNVLALAGLGLLGGILARDGGRHPLWGLLLPAFPGFLFSLGRDLTEIVAAVFVVAGLLAWRRGRPALAGVALTIAVLSRETALLAVAGIFAAHMADLRGRPAGSAFAAQTRTQAQAQAHAWVLPAAGFGLWQAAVAAATGTLPVSAGSGDNMAVPLTGLASALVGWIHDVAILPGPASALLALVTVGQFAALCVMAGLAAGRLRDADGAIEVKVGGALAVLLAVCLSSFVLRTPTFFRQLTDVHVFAAVALLGTPGRLRVPGGALAALWLASALVTVVTV
jgi:hypothetical protein